MKILAIETSCDDTCVAVLQVENRKFKILSSVVSSQAKLHAKYGGVYPFLAKREHQRNLPLVFKKALKEAGSPKIDLIALTFGPGLEPCLWTGINFAKELAGKMNLKIVPTNHIEAHLLVNLLDPDCRLKKTERFPAVCLVVSGGHTQLVLMKKLGEYKVIGETRDDAAGECFDKTARILGLGYPGGPVIAVKAKEHNLQNTKYKIQLPRPMINHKNYDFSFSGLKTAVLYDAKKHPEKNEKYVRAMAAEIQQAIIDVLIRKTIVAAKNYKAKTIILAGGVAANEELRKQFGLKIEAAKLNLELLFPPKNLCTDNALMTAVAGYFNRQKKKNWKKIKADANLKIGE